MIHIWSDFLQRQKFDLYLLVPKSIQGMVNHQQVLNLNVFLVCDSKRENFPAPPYGSILFCASHIFFAKKKSLRLYEDNDLEFSNWKLQVSTAYNLSLEKSGVCRQGSQACMVEGFRQSWEDCDWDEREGIKIHSLCCYVCLLLWEKVIHDAKYFT